MPGAEEIKARINSIRDTKKVTDAMYMISSVKMRRARRDVESTKPYFDALNDEIAVLFRYMPETENRYFHVPSPEKGKHMRHGILLITSDKGLAGSYNQSAIALAEDYRRRHPETVFFVVGEYGRQYFISKKIPFREDFIYPAEHPSVWEAKKICLELLEYYNDGRLDEINVIYTDYRPGKPSECRISCLLPLERSRFSSEARDDKGQKYEFYPNPDAVLENVVPSYLSGYIYSLLVESYCSEQEARIDAMSSAGKNAENMLRELRIKYNRVRQAAITREITEITAGARAIAKKKSPLSRKSQKQVE